MGGKRDIDDQSPRRVRVLTRDDGDRSELAAKPRSAIQTSPGRGFIDEVQDFLLHPAKPSGQPWSALVFRIEQNGEGGGFDVKFEYPA